MDKFSCFLLEITKIFGLQNSYGNVIPDLDRWVFVLVWHSPSLIVEELCSFLWATLSTFVKSITEITNSMRSLCEFIYVRLPSPFLCVLSRYKPLCLSKLENCNWTVLPCEIQSRISDGLLWKIKYPEIEL